MERQKQQQNQLRNHLTITLHKMIRHATKYDIPALTELVKQFCSAVPSKIANQLDNFDEQNVQKVLMTAIAGCGFVLIDEEQNGFIAAIVGRNTWFPKILELHELAWWVKPEHRNSSLGGRLFIEFNKIAKQWLKEDRVQAVFATLTANSPQIDYEKRGYHLLESHYLMES